ncbi:MAG: HlyD family efflux transporter periplasmic adaptor subunit [Pseudomonadota bacterium]
MPAEAAVPVRREANETEQNKAAAPFAVLLQLEAKTRTVESLKGLEFLIANDTRRILRYGQACVFRRFGRRLRLSTISSIAVVDRSSPSVRWSERVASRAVKECPDGRATVLTPESLPERLRVEWSEFSFPHVVLAPFFSRKGRLLGALWLSKTEPWTPAELTLVDRVRDTYAHTWLNLLLGEPRVTWIGRHAIASGLAVLLAVTMLLPVKMSALAPAEVVPNEPYVAAAPMDGVIEEVVVDPGAPVAEGDLLFTFEDTELRNRATIAARRLEVVEASIAQAKQGAFFDDDSRAKVELLQSEAALARIELDYAQDLLERTEVYAQRPGIALITDAADWKGRPVRTGERVMAIARPRSMKLRMHLPVEDAIVLAEDKRAALFLDVDPLTRHEAVIEHASFEAEVTESDVLAFRIDGALLGAQRPLRVGLKGTVKLYGAQTTMFLFLFRRPVSALRQFVGF